MYGLINQIPAKPSFFSLLLILSLLFPSEKLTAQESNQFNAVSIGEQHILPASAYMPRVFGHDDTAYFALARDYLFEMERYSEDLKSTAKEDMKLYRKLRTRDLIAAVEFFDTLYIFSMEERARYNFLWVETIDKETMKQNMDMRVIFQSRHIRGWQTEFGVAMSRKENKLLVYSQNILPYQNMHHLEFKVFDKGMELQWERTTEARYERIYFHDSQFEVDEAGNVFMLDHYYEPMLPRPINPRKNQYFYLAVTDNGEKVIKDQIFFRDRYIKDINLEVHGERDMAVTGLWSDRRFEGLASGLFYFRLNTTSAQMEDLSFHEFPEDVIKGFLDVKPDSEQDEMLGIQLIDFRIRKSGHYIAVAEQKFDQSYNSDNNVLVYSINPDGSVGWYHVIHKRQNLNTIDQWEYNSIAMIAPTDADWIGIIYNDNLKNLNNPSRKPRSFSHTDKSFLNMVQFNRYGDRREFVLYERKRRRDPTPIPSLAYDMRTNAIVMPANRYRKYVMMKIEAADFPGSLPIMGVE